MKHQKTLKTLTNELQTSKEHNTFYGIRHQKKCKQKRKKSISETQESTEFNNMTDVFSVADIFNLDLKDSQKPYGVNATSFPITSGCTFETNQHKEYKL